MCNRYVAPERQIIEEYWGLNERNLVDRWESDLFPHMRGPFLRGQDGQRVLVVGQWGLIPDFAQTARLTYQTNNARAEELMRKASFRRPWLQSQRCIIAALSFDEPCWETGKNVWWRFSRTDGMPWGLAGLWNAWTDRQTGEVVESYTMLTLNADSHPLLSRVHKPKPDRRAHAQDKRAVIPIAINDVDAWLHSTPQDARNLLRLPAAEEFQVQEMAHTSLLVDAQQRLF